MARQKTEKSYVVLCSYPITSLGIIKRTCPIMHDLKPYCTCCKWKNRKQSIGSCYLHKNRIEFTRSQVYTHIQAKKASSKEFWKRMMWMRRRMRRGLLNQKWLSEGWTTNSPSTTICLSATSWANCVIICSNLVPTASKSCQKEKQITFSNLLQLQIYNPVFIWIAYNEGNECYPKIRMPTCIKNPISILS